MITITLEEQDLAGRPATHIQLRDTEKPGHMTSRLVVHSSNPKLHAPELLKQSQISHAVGNLLREWWAEADQ